MGDVIVAGATEIGQAASNRQAAWVILGDTHFRTGDFHRRGKTAVKVEKVHIRHRHVRHREGFTGHRRHRRRAMEVFAITEKPVIMGVGAAVEIDPAFLGDAQGTRFGDRGQNDGGGLVDKGVGIHELGVGEADIRIVGANGGDITGREAVAPIGQRIASGNSGETREQGAHGLAVLGDGPAAGAADGVFDHRIGENRTAHAVAFLAIAPAALLNTPGLKVAAQVLVPVQLYFRALRRLLRRQSLAAGDQRRLDLAAGHHLRQTIDAPLRHVSASVSIDQAVGGHRAQAPGQRFRRVGDPPERAGEAPTGVAKGADHNHRVEGRQQGRADPGVGGGVTRGVRGQVDGRAGNRRIRFPLCHLAGPHQNRYPRFIHDLLSSRALFALILAGPRRQMQVTLATALDGRPRLRV